MPAPSRCRRSCRSPARSGTRAARSIPDADTAWFVEPTRCSMTRSQERDVRWALIAATLIVASTGDLPAAERPAIDNAHVRVYRTSVDALAGINHGPGV